MPRLTKIYTRKGDKGYTALGKNQFSKDDLLIDVIGTIDELNSMIGLVMRSTPKMEKSKIASLEFKMICLI